MDLSMYTEQSRKVMEDAIANAKAVLDDEKSAQETVDEALKRLQEAEKGLELIPSTPVKKEDLKKKLDEAEQYRKELDSYTPVTREAFVKAYELAKRYMRMKRQLRKRRCSIWTIAEGDFDLRQIPSKEN